MPGIHPGRDIHTRWSEHMGKRGAFNFRVRSDDARRPEPSKSYRERDGSHQAALRALAFKWIRILHRRWVDRQPYDEARYLMAPPKRHAPLLAFAARAST